MSTQAVTIQTELASAISPVRAGERVEVIDVLRGFALLGIVIVNMGAFKGASFGSLSDAGVLDQAASWLIAFGFQTKFYVLFSFLFGYGLSMQMNRAPARNAPFVPRFLRRLLGLLLIGLAHAVLLFTGDILVTYALLGLILLLVRNAPDTMLLRIAGSLIAGTVLLLTVFGVVIALSSGSAPATAEASAAITGSAAAYRGSPADVIAERIREYPGTLAFALFGQGPTALAMFLVGLWAGRRRLLERVDDHLPLLRRVLIVGLTVGVPGALIWATFRVRNGFTFDANFLWAAAVDFATAPFLSAVYATTIVLLYRNTNWRRRLAPFVAVGRLSLSNYLLQSIVAALIFTGYGLRLYGQVGAAWGLALSVTLFAVQIPLSAWWLQHFQFGPAEWLLRSFTYRKLQSLRRTTTAKA
jgi:uncharacterized protein